MKKLPAGGFLLYVEDNRNGCVGLLLVVLPSRALLLVIAL